MRFHNGPRRSTSKVEMTTLIDTERANHISREIIDCRLCDAYSNNNALCIDDKEFGLNYFYPPSIPIEIMFVAESPPAPGKGFFYDKDSTNKKFRNKLFKLLNKSGLGSVHSLNDFTKKGYYLADAINCRWDKSKKKSLPKTVFQNCSFHLAKQIKLFKPNFIVAMGCNAQISLTFHKPRMAINDLAIPDENIIEMAFILVAPNETDEQRIRKLKKIIHHVNH